MNVFGDGHLSYSVTGKKSISLLMYISLMKMPNVNYRGAIGRVKVFDK